MSRNVTPEQVSRKVFDKHVDLLKARIKDRSDEIRKLKQRVGAIDNRLQVLEAIYRATYPNAEKIGKLLVDE